MKTLFLILFSFTTAWAQTSQIEARRDQLTQTGKLFTVKVVPGAGLTSFYVVGKKAVDIKSDKLQLEATFFQGLDDQKGQKVILKRYEDHFRYEGPLQPDRIQLQIQGEQPQHVDKLEIKLKN